MKVSSNILLHLFLIPTINCFSQGGILESRIINDTSVVLTYSNKTKLELNRQSKTICERTYYEDGRIYFEMQYNSYHVENGIFKAYDSMGAVYFMVDNLLGKAYVHCLNGKVVVLDKPQIFINDEEILKKRYGPDFVNKHIPYFPNDYFKYGSLDTFTQNVSLQYPSRNETYTKGFKLMLNNGKVVNCFSVPFQFDTKTNQEKMLQCSGTTDFLKYSFCDTVDSFVDIAKEFGLLRSRDYVGFNFTALPCSNSLVSSGEIQLNLIEILTFDTAKNRVNYNVYSFNPWTKNFMGKQQLSSSLNNFVYNVINFEEEIFIHRFKDPTIYMPQYLKDIIKFYPFTNYQYLIDKTGE